jgi:transcriptional regulator with XRE-family HTH domain
MRCERCGAGLSVGCRTLCALCEATSGDRLPTIRSASPDAVWLWVDPNARQAVESRDLGVILKAFRAATGASQRSVAEDLGYDPTYISMIESGRRRVADVGTRRNFSQYLGLPPHVLGVTNTGRGDFAAMLQFAAATIRLAVVARQSGRAADGVNELWPLIVRLEERAASGDADRDALILLSRARAELGVALGDLLPEERLTAAVRWTGRALHLAQRLEHDDLLVHALRVHGNELRKTGHRRAAIVRLSRAMEQASDSGERASATLQLARAAGEIGDADLVDDCVRRARLGLDAGHPASGITPFVLREVELRGYQSTGRLRQAIKQLDSSDAEDPSSSAPQWQAIERTTVAGILLADHDTDAATQAYREAIGIADILRLPHQVQRVIRAARGRIDEIAEQGQLTLARLQRQLGS